MPLLIHLKRGSRTPLYRQIVDEIRRFIENGALAPGDRLPPSRKLAEMLAVDRSTVMTAYAELQALGFTASRQGGYTTVVSRKAEAGYNPARRGLLDWPRLSSNAAEAVHRASAAHAAERAFPAGPGPPFDLVSIELDPRLYPLADVRRCLRGVMSETGAEPLRYGDPMGYPPLRETLARRLRLHGISVSEREILITNGAQHGLDLIVRVLGGPDRVAVVELPTYASLIPLLRLGGLKIAGVPMTDAGLDLDALDKVLSQKKPAFIYTMPSFQNPTGLTTSHAHRERLLDISVRRRVPIVEDGFEDDMKYFGPVPLPLKSIDDQGLVIYVGTFSKALFPGLRVGWIAADRPLVDRLAAVKRFSDLATNSFGQMMLDRFCRLGFYDRHLQRIHRVFRRRMRTAMQAAERHFPPGVSWTRPAGGYTIWVRLPKAVEAGRLARCARESGVAVSPGGAYFPDGGPSEFVRLSIARVDEGEIKEAFGRLGRAWRTLIK